MKKIRTNKKPLTEGAGAGYKFEGNLSIDKVNKIKSIKPTKQTSNGITWTFAEIELDADATFEGTVASYYYDGYLNDIEMKITKIIVNDNFLDYDMEPGSNYTDITAENLDQAFSYGYLKVKSKVIGSGYKFKEFDGKIEFKDAESDFSGGEIDKIECVITDDKVIRYINNTLTGETHHEEYYITVDGKQISNGAFVDYEDAMDRVATVLLPDGDNHVVVYFKSWDDMATGDTEEYEEEVVWDSEENTLEESLKEAKEDTIELTVDDILKLRKEIKLNSIYTRDYTNTLGIDPKWVAVFFDGYVDYLVELSEEQNVIDFLDLDTEENLRAFINTLDDSSLTAPIEETCRECKTESCETTEDKQVVEDVEVKVPTETTTDSPVETTKEDTDTGIASLLNTAIRDEWQTIDLYNSLIATFKDLEKYKEISVEKKEQLSNIITDILHEELKHVGQLQSALDLVNQPVDNIAKGEQEGKEQAKDISLIKSDTEEVQPTTEIKDIEITDKPVELDTASDLNEDDIEILASYFGTED